MNTHGTLNSGSWNFKVYNYNSERGVPGAIVNNVWRRGERIWDTNSFAQGRYTGFFGKFTTLNNIKYAFYRTHYVNNDDKQVKIDNLYKQKEIYFSSANEYEVTNFCSVSASYDFMWNTLDADVYGFVKPDRISHFLSAATALNFNRIKIQASALGTFIHDKIRGQKAPADKHVFSPAIFMNGYPLRNKDFSIRVFYKQSFRVRLEFFFRIFYGGFRNGFAHAGEGVQRAA